MATTCPDCGGALPAQGGEGLCLRCVVRNSLEVSPGADARAATSDLAASAVSEPAPTRDARRLGDYELMEELARGGMGVVYKARQLSLNRTVALKMIRGGSGATAEAIQRFRTEAEAAAALQHPNIVPIYEVGEQDGQYFFSMEYVAGSNLADLVREQPLPPGEAARYVKAVAEAIHFAHEHDVLHRDLKPSNVLIDAFDQPRVTDFGLAKRLGDGPEVTRTGQVLGTPQYLPPEQVTREAGVVGWHSDVYSLGAILYHLVAGRPPFLAATVEQTLLYVLDREPVSPRALNPAVPRDLETICLKCLEKEPARRYSTAQELAKELGRFVRHEPIHARPVSSPEQLWRWCRRKPALASLAAALVVTTLTGFSIVLWQLEKTDVARHEAVTAATRSQEVADFLKDMLRGVGPSKALGRDTTMLREILDETTRRLNQDLKGQPEVKADLQDTLGSVHYQLGEYDRAETFYRESLSIREKLHGRSHHDVARSLGNLAAVAQAQGRVAEAEAIQRESLGMLRKWFGPEHPQVAAALANLAALLQQQGQLAAAEALHRESLEMRQKLFGDEHPDVAGSLNNLAGLFQARGQLAEAEALFRKVLAMEKKLAGDGHPRVARVLSNLGAILERAGKLEEAEALHREALTLRRKLFGAEHPDVAKSLDNLAAVLVRQARLAEAETLHREALAMRKKLLGDEHPDVASSQTGLAMVLRRRGKLGETESLHREALAMRKKLFGPMHPEVASSLSNVALALGEQGELGEAESLFREALAMKRTLLGPEHPSVANALNNLASLLVRQNKATEAETLYRDALEMRRKLLGTKHPDVATSLHNLAYVLGLQNQFSEAETLYREAVTVRKELPDGGRSAASSQDELFAVLERQGKLSEAELLLRDVLDVARERHGKDSREAALAATALVRNLLKQQKFADAEPLAEAGLKTLEQLSAIYWRTLEARSLFGACLLGQKRHSQAESFLLSGYAGLKQRERQISKGNEGLLRDALERLVRLYETSGQAAKAAEWKEQLVEFDRAAAAMKPSTIGPDPTD